ncbi:MAG: DNA topoisomerase I [Thermodesulfobacteriota bacterium]|nr:DNA topoisomerase I [Thermodesulfobacteriota bacterium]
MVDESKDSIDASKVRFELDEILAKEIISFIDMDTDIAMVSYNLANISCVLLAVEREREIKSFAEFPPERFTRDSLVKELVEIGLDANVYLQNAVDSVFQKGYLSLNSKKEIVAEASAYTMVGFLDNMFPGMQGMNLIAFVMQMNDEVLSGRKTLEEAKKNFAQTLKSRGVAVTKEKIDAKTEDTFTRVSFKETREVSEKLKEAASKRLSSLRQKRSGTSPSLYSSDGYASEKIKVKDVFEKGPSKEELAAKEAARAEEERAAREVEQRYREISQREEALKAAEAEAKEVARKAKELELREQQLAKAEEEALKSREKADNLKAREAEIEAREAEVKAMEEKLKAAEAEAERLAQENRDRKAAETAPENQAEPSEDIESKIAAFEADLAMECPVCHKGKVVSEETPAGKAYFTCTNSECRFVSWHKPYHFSCPLCRNSYLVETETANGKGLKCPRASCSYSQETLLDPALIAAEMNSAPKKKKKVVRRVRKKR